MVLLPIESFLVGKVTGGEEPSILCLTLVSCFSSGPSEVPGPVRCRDLGSPEEHWGVEGGAYGKQPHIVRTSHCRAERRMSTYSQSRAYAQCVQQVLELSGREERVHSTCSSLSLFGGCDVKEKVYVCFCFPLRDSLRRPVRLCSRNHVIVRRYPRTCNLMAWTHLYIHSMNIFCAHLVPNIRAKSISIRVLNICLKCDTVVQIHFQITRGAV